MVECSGIDAGKYKLSGLRVVSDQMNFKGTFFGTKVSVWKHDRQTNKWGTLLCIKYNQICEKVKVVFVGLISHLT